MSLYDPDLDIAWLISDFEPISLDALNAKAEMMSRIDCKYIASRADLEPLLPRLLDSFDILEIERRRAFCYETRYFDDPDRAAYYEHHQGKRKGFKVRVRRYADGGPCYLEVKVKGQRGATLKHRQPYDPANLATLTPDALDFARTTYGDHYGMPFTYDLHHSLDVRYHRVTLVAKEGGERVTIDACLQFRSRSGALDGAGDVFIVETKSERGRGLADRALRKAGVRPTKKCSKYCIGVAALGEVSRWNRFLPAMRGLKLTDRPPVELPAAA